MDMLREARRRVGPPPPTDIQVGSMIKFRGALLDQGAPLTVPASAFDSWTFGGIPVRLNQNLPENMVVILQGKRVVSIINLDEPK
ncbi:hypothetical protein KX928_23290 [Roseobacter sp. YSTF-M11]|uniref:Uncharacterized protein n=1 Tax=Roseobacter insulae TaxID=2859783 RepID=A0A9X1G129_9RHOB|nr:hypothetical protein [Roseobacter insulae]MBW4710725.1 hypothetical protein [Roseobacter insulae]